MIFTDFILNSVVYGELNSAKKNQKYIHKADK